ncbi:MAG: type II toxin-antitoxin system PemK/MazF family toxin [Bacteroidota bacterium]
MKRSEIWLINLDPTVGAEIRKIRPAIIVSDDNLGLLPLKVIVPITDWKPRYEKADWMVELKPNKSNGLDKHSAADCFQVRSLSKKRIYKKIGALSNERMTAIEQALVKVLNVKI